MYNKDLIIQKNEIDRRIKLLQDQLINQNIDYAFIIQNADIFYFTGFVSASILLISQKDTILFCRKDIDNVKNFSNLSNIVKINSFKDIGDYIESDKIQGFELDVVPYSMINYFKKILNPSKLVDISSLIRDVRAIKSDVEIRYIKKAANLLNILCREIVNYIKPGITEVEIFAKAQEILIKNGHQGYTRMRGFNQEMFYGHLLSGEEGIISGYLDAPTCGSGIYPAFPQGSSNRVIKQGDLVSVDLVGAYNGYHADQTRPFSCGKIDGIYYDNFQKALEIQDEVVSMIKPGIAWEDAYYKGIKIAKKLKIDEYFMGYFSKVKFIGHGIGVEVDEYPFLSPNFKKEFLPNMVFAIEPKIFLPKYGVIGIENTYLITENGCEKITISPDKITTA